MENSDKKKDNYGPLAVVTITILLGALALEHSYPEMAVSYFMPNFMGLFFLIFAMFKLFDIRGFADGFQMYDIIAKKHRTYAYAYPFIELALGLLYLSQSVMFLTNLLTVIIMFVSAAGVIISVRNKMNIRCACLGTVLNVPLSTVSIIENVGMGVMALWMLVA